MPSHAVLPASVVVVASCVVRGRGRGGSGSGRGRPTIPPRSCPPDLRQEGTTACAHRVRRAQANASNGSVATHRQADATRQGKARQSKPQRMCAAQHRGQVQATKCKCWGGRSRARLGQHPCCGLAWHSNNFRKSTTAVPPHTRLSIARTSSNSKRSGLGDLHRSRLLADFTNLFVEVHFPHSGHGFLSRLLLH